MQSAGTLLRKVRIRAGLSQAELARRGGTSAPTVCAYENGRNDPRGATLARLLEVADSELLAGPRPADRGSRTIHSVPVRRTVELAAKGIRRALTNGDEELAFRTALDVFDRARSARPSDLAGIVSGRPPLTQDARYDALLAAIVEDVCADRDLEPPGWTSEGARFVRPFWFVSPYPSTHAWELATCPIAFSRHGVIAGAEELASV